MANTKYSYDEKRKGWTTLVYDGTLTASGGKHRKRITSRKSSADLEKKVLEFKLNLEKGNLQLSNITFGEYARQWLTISKATRELNTIRMYEGILDSCFDSINNIPLARITHSNIQSCINLKMDHPRTCQIMLLTIKQIIKSAIRDHYISHASIDELTTDISLPKRIKPQKKPLSLSEKAAIKAADLDKRERAFISILYYCGLRKGEALALTKEDFDWNNKTLSVSRAWITYKNQPSIKPYPKSDNGIRVIPIPDVAIPLIKDYVKLSGDYLFSENGLITSHKYETMWKRILRKLNAVSDKPISITAHILRHNYCTELCYQIPLISSKKIAQLLGDTEKMVLDVYSHIVEDKENTTAAINNVFS